MHSLCPRPDEGFGNGRDGRCTYPIHVLQVPERYSSCRKATWRRSCTTLELTFSETLGHEQTNQRHLLRPAPDAQITRLHPVAVMTLALGIGANAAIFTLIHAILLRPLPVKDPSALYRIGSHEVNCCVIGGLQDEWDIYSYPLVSADPEADPGIRRTSGVSKAARRK